MKSYGIIALGSVLFGLAFDWFFDPNQVAMGGITGLAQVINALLPGIPVGVLTLSLIHILMIGFGIDQVQAEFVAEIKLRNINKEYILKRVNETEALQNEIDDLEDILSSPRRVKKIIVEELTACLLYTSRCV